MKRILIAVIFFMSAITASAAAANDPAADASAVVTFGSARFTVLTPRLIRMEWSENGRFEDRATLGVVNRKLDVPEFETGITGDELTLRTSGLVLKYRNTGRFTEDNLSVTFTMAAGQDGGYMKEVVWHPGADEDGNLLGTSRTLDGCDGFRTVEPYDPGIISRDGWAILDESERHVFREDDSDWGHWVEPRDGTERQDYYIFAYGHDYKAALSDFTKISGRIPMPPKYAFGYWWSRYWQYSDYEFEELAAQIRELGIPIDVMVVDMDWHETWSLRLRNAPKDEFGQSIGWTGYTWQEQLFPNPSNFLKSIHRLGMKTALNIHPASGIQTYEESYDRFVRDYTSRTDNYDGPENFRTQDGRPVPVPFRISDRDWTDAYFNSVIHPLESLGVDFWWIDWQQWKYSRYMDGLNITFWLNHTFFSDKLRKSVNLGKYAGRPMIYHRWGGLGSHRYQIGFSGDTFDTWQVLSYLPYFTSTASNVCYGYWGHDIGGHTQKRPHPTDPELYTRWLQYGVFTPIFKTHATKSSFLERRIWAFPEYFDVMKKAIRLRYSLSPYIYTAARQAYDTGVSICRPMYYDYPESEESYARKEQYMFGDDILATVVSQPVDKSTGMASRDMWFPEGCDWYDMATGRMIAGGTCDTLYYTIDENPYYVKAGAIIPMAPDKIQSLQEKSDEINFFVAPGDGEYSSRLYEDDGESQAYDTEYAYTDIYKYSDAKSAEIIISARRGKYRGMSDTRSVNVVLEAVPVPERITVNGRPVEYSRFPEDDIEDGKARWTYVGKDLSVKIFIPSVSGRKDLKVECSYGQDSGLDRNIIFGKKGLMHRMMAITPELKAVFGTKVDMFIRLPDDFLAVAQCASHITEDPSNVIGYLKGIDTESMIECFAGYSGVPDEVVRKIAAQSLVGE